MQEKRDRTPPNLDEEFEDDDEEKLPHIPLPIPLSTISNDAQNLVSSFQEVLSMLLLSRN
jgi:hypothetical protein